jgi:hypothetical protein
MFVGMARARGPKRRRAKAARRRKTRSARPAPPARSRQSPSKPKRKSPPARPPKIAKARLPVPVAVDDPPSPAELMLLGLARDIDPPLTSSGGARPGLAVVVERVASAFDPGAPLPRALYQAWADSRADKTRALALAWAREQLRLGIEDVLQAEGRPDTPRAIPGPTLAWLLLAAFESLAHEPAAAVSDRVRALLDLAGTSAATLD